MIFLIGSAEIGDPEGTRTVLAIITLLVVMGVALVMLAVWLRHTTRPDPEFLAPLELMGDRSWRRSDPVWQRRRLDEVRSPSAVPLRRAVAPPDLDEAFDEGPSVEGFDDLRDASGGVPSPASGSDTQGDGVTTVPVVPGEPDTSVSGDREPGNETPTSPQRPFVDDLGEDELDADLVAQADADLEAELDLGERWQGPQSDR